MCYLFTLYLYAVVILIRWELPNGWVSWLTSFLMFGMLAIIYMVYPQQFHPNKNNFERLLMRWLPIMVIPLLVLMSIGIYRRITDYGISIDRLYLLLFNVWCYVVCFTLFVINSRRIWWIPASFCLLFFLTSVGPWSFTSITKRILLHEVEDALKTSGKTLPMNKESYNSWVEGLTTNNIHLNDKLYYLSDNYGNAVRNHIVADSVWTYRRSIADIETNTVTEEDKAYEIEEYGLMKKRPISIPEGYATLEYIEMGDVENVEFKEDTLSFKIRDNSYFLTYKNIFSSWENKNEQCLIQSDDFVLAINDILFDREKEVFNFNGILLKK